MRMGRGKKPRISQQQEMQNLPTRIFRISVSNLIARNPRAAQKFLKDTSRVLHSAKKSKSLSRRCVFVFNVRREELSSLIGQRIQATEVSVPKRCPSGPSLLSLLGISDDS